MNASWPSGWIVKIDPNLNYLTLLSLSCRYREPTRWSCSILSSMMTRRPWFYCAPIRFMLLRPSVKPVASASQAIFGIRLVQEKPWPLIRFRAICSRYHLSKRQSLWLIGQTLTSRRLVPFSLTQRTIWSISTRPMIHRNWLKIWLLMTVVSLWRPSRKSMLWFVSLMKGVTKSSTIVSNNSN